MQSFHSKVSSSNPLLKTHLAAQLDVEQRRGWGWVAGTDNAERWGRRGWLVVLKGEPPGVYLAEGRTSNLVVICLRIRN